MSAIKRHSTSQKRGSTWWANERARRCHEPAQNTVTGTRPSSRGSSSAPFGSESDAVLARDLVGWRSPQSPRAFTAGLRTSTNRSCHIRFKRLVRSPWTEQFSSANGNRASPLREVPQVDKPDLRRALRSVLGVCTRGIANSSTHPLRYRQAHHPLPLAFTCLPQQSQSFHPLLYTGRHPTDYLVREVRRALDAPPSQATFPS